MKKIENIQKYSGKRKTPDEENSINSKENVEKIEDAKDEINEIPPIMQIDYDELPDGVYDFAGLAELQNRKTRPNLRENEKLLKNKNKKEKKQKERKKNESKKKRHSRLLPEEKSLEEHKNIVEEIFEAKKNNEERNISNNLINKEIREDERQEKQEQPVFLNNGEYQKETKIKEENEYQVGIKNKLENANLEYQPEVKTELENSKPEYQPEVKTELNNGKLEYQPEIKNKLENEKIDYELEIKDKLENVKLEYQPEVKNKLENEKLEDQPEIKNKLESTKLEYHPEIRNKLENRKIEYQLEIENKLENSEFQNSAKRLEVNENNELLEESQINIPEVNLKNLEKINKNLEPRRRNKVKNSRVELIEDEEEFEESFTEKINNFCTSNKKFAFIIMFFLGVITQISFLATSRENNIVGIFAITIFAISMFLLVNVLEIKNKILIFIMSLIVVLVPEYTETFITGENAIIYSFSILLALFALNLVFVKKNRIISFVLAVTMFAIGYKIFRDCMDVFLVISIIKIIEEIFNRKERILNFLIHCAMICAILSVVIFL